MSRIYESWVKEAKVVSAGKSGSRMKVWAPKKAARAVATKIPETKSLGAVNRAVMGVARMPKHLRIALSLAKYGNLMENKESLKLIRSLVNPGKKYINAKPIKLKSLLRREGGRFRTKESIGDWVKGVWNKVKNATPGQAAAISAATVSPGLFIAHTFGSKKGLVRGAIRKAKADKLWAEHPTWQRKRRTRPFRINPPEQPLNMRDQL